MEELVHGSTYYVAITSVDTEENQSPYSEEFTVSAVDDAGAHSLRHFYLAQNAPNPFAPQTMIRYTLPEAVHVRVIVHDVEGRQVAVLVDEQQEAGARQVTWDGRDRTGRPVPSGLYFYRAEMGQEVMVRKMLMVR